MGDVPALLNGKNKELAEKVFDNVEATSGGEGPENCRGKWRQQRVETESVSLSMFLEVNISKRRKNSTGNASVGRRSMDWQMACRRKRSVEKADL